MRVLPPYLPVCLSLLACGDKDPPASSKPTEPAIDTADTGEERDCVDADGDGFSTCDEDPDDQDPYTYPGSDDVDDDGDGYSEAQGDCNDRPDQDGAAYSPETVWYADADGDGFGPDAEDQIVSCEPTGSYTAREVGDSDDADPYTFAGAPELCDGKRNNDLDAAWTEDVNLTSEYRPDGTWVPVFYRDTGTIYTHTVSTAGATIVVCPGVSYTNLLIKGRDVVVAGQGQGVSILSGGTFSTPLEADRASGLTVQDLTLTDGSGTAGGGAELHDSSVTLRDLTITANASDECGGIGVFGGSLALERVTLTDNITTYEGSSYSAPGSGGGGCIEDSSVTISDSVISGNTAGWAGGGLYLSSSSVVEIDNSTITGNTGVRGGGLYGGSVSLSVDAVVISANIASGGGGIRMRSSGSLLVQNSQIIDNVATDTGGGIMADSQTFTFYISMTIEDSEILRNTAGAGGGVYAENTTVLGLKRTTLQHNSAGTGGGIWFSGATTPAVTISDAVIEENTATGSGGGFYGYRTEPSISDTSLSRNSASKGGAIYLEDTDSAALSRLTLSANTATEGAGLYVGYDAVATLKDSLLTGNVATRGGGHYHYSATSARLTTTGTSFAKNIPEDTYHRSGTSYVWGSDASFTCDASECD